jgi:hypothetical protein
VTLVAFTARPERVDLVCDTICYSRTARFVHHTTKAIVLSHLNAVLAATGPTEFLNRWAYTVNTTHVAGSFDELVEVSPSRLSEGWGEFLPPRAFDRRRRGITEAPKDWVTIAAVGWSHAADEAAAYTFASHDDFTAVDRRRSLYVSLDENAPYDVPDTDEDWVALAEGLRPVVADSRLGSKVLIAGQLVHTRVERDSVTQRTIHRFDDTGEDWQRMFWASLHPLGLDGECVCRGKRGPAGARFRDCCILRSVRGDIPDGLCPCDSYRRFRDCCLPQVLEDLARLDAGAAPSEIS